MSTDTINNPPLTPMMQQYSSIKSQLPSNTLLLFRLGDFYELFNEDAQEASRLLDITLTQRHGTPMAGIPYHASENYISKLLKAGKKVGICDQLEAPQPGKLVKRALTRILTPGTTIEDSQIQSNSNHYLLALNYQKNTLHAAWLDISTGSFAIASDSNPHNLFPVFSALNPKEIILPEKAFHQWKSDEKFAQLWSPLSSFILNKTLTTVQDFFFDPLSSSSNVMQSLGVISLEGFGISNQHPALSAASALIHYSTETLCSPPKNLRHIQEYQPKNYLILDPATQRNLEIFKTTNSSRQGSLLDAIDKTTTAAGARLLENYLATPSLDLPEILRRQNLVSQFVQLPHIASEIHSTLALTRDSSRILGRLQNKFRNPKDLGALRDTLNQLPQIITTLQSANSPLLSQFALQIDPLPELTKLLSRALRDELPNSTQEGNIIRQGFDPKLDHLLSLSLNNKVWINDLETQEQQRTGIKNLKIKYTDAFGYYIEVTKANLHLVPPDYIRKQTMVNAERFVTEQLKQKEKEILNAEQQSIAYEIQLLQDLVQQTIQHAHPIYTNSLLLAELDLFASWGLLALEWNYSKPSLDNSDTLEILEGRHPVVEQILYKNRFHLPYYQNFNFVPNNTFLSSSQDQIALITGPNMAGKSTYIRQVALITLMAQIGSWVPAKRCHVGLVDRIFSRVGASDELSKGNSTFMVEMNETANILNNSTPKSLIILDEIGRGTSTYDGLSIAWAVIEFLHPQNQGPRTLFATHYHELTKLEDSLPRLRNYSVAVKEWNDQILFLRQVIPGPADRSYGIQVAKLAGIPQQVIDRASTILQELESEGDVIKQHLTSKILSTPLPQKRPPKSSPIDPPLHNQLHLL